MQQSCCFPAQVTSTLEVELTAGTAKQDCLSASRTTPSRGAPTGLATLSPHTTFFPWSETRRRTMPDDLKQRGAQDRARISMSEDYEVRYWTEALGVSKEQLAAAVTK